jgi:hypothetical protein
MDFCMQCKWKSNMHFVLCSKVLPFRTPLVGGEGEEGRKRWNACPISLSYQINIPKHSTFEHESRPLRVLYTLLRKRQTTLSKLQSQ